MTVIIKETISFSLFFSFWDISLLSFSHVMHIKSNGLKSFDNLFYPAIPCFHNFMEFFSVNKYTNKSV